ncbi:MAG TPA: hypothetical protein VNC61_04845 [Acidimicrobiales bacterium]|nr:hypothetical protein [Acidimicrobiales bacterium]
MLVNANAAMGRFFGHYAIAGRAPDPSEPIGPTPAGLPGDPALGER